jgi:hypothetical protein
VASAVDWAGILNWLSVGFALLAAGFWLLSAVVRLPKKITAGYGGVGGTAQEMGEALCRQAGRSMVAAVCAALASACQAIVLSLPLLG